MIKKNFFNGIVWATLQILLVFLVINGVFAACSLGVRLSLMGAAFIVLIYEGWKVLDD